MVFCTPVTPSLPLKRDLDIVLLVRSILHRLGAGRLDTFKERLRNQKIQYFAQVFRVSPMYEFNLYIHGPYSPDLTRDLFGTQEYSIAQTSFVALEAEARFNRLKAFVAGKAPRDLELLATYHWLKNIARVGNPSSSLRTIKGATAQELEYCKAKLQQVSL